MDGLRVFMWEAQPPNSTRSCFMQKMWVFCEILIYAIFQWSVFPVEFMTQCTDRNIKLTK